MGTDVRMALRRLRAAPGFALVALLTLALGIGANTAVFSVANAFLLRPLSFRDEDRLITVWQDHRAIGREEPEWFTPPDFFDLRHDNRTFESVVAYQGWGATLVGEGEPRRVGGLGVTHDWFRVLGVPLAQGRHFTPDEDVPDAPRVVIVSHAFWQGELGGRADVVGATLRLNDNPWTIVGVLPKGYVSPMGDAAIYRPLRLPADRPCGRGC